MSEGRAEEKVEAGHKPDVSDIPRTFLRNVTYGGTKSGRDFFD